MLSLRMLHTPSIICKAAVTSWCFELALSSQTLSAHQSSETPPQSCCLRRMCR